MNRPKFSSLSAINSRRSRTGLFVGFAAMSAGMFFAITEPPVQFDPPVTSKFTLRQHVPPATESHQRSGPSPSLRPPDTFQARTLGNGGYTYDVVDGELLVQIKPDLEQDDIRRFAANMQSEVLAFGSYSPYVRLKIPDGKSMEQFQADLRKEAWTVDAHPNAIAEATGCSTGEYSEHEWNFDEIGGPQACSSYASALDAIVIAVMDTGVAYENYTDSSYTYAKASDLNAVNFVPGYDFTNNDSHPNDDNQHGTHITSIIAARGKVSGVAQGASIMPIKVLGANKLGSEFAVVEGLGYAVANGADVVNMSFSFGLGYFPSAALQSAIDAATTAGLVLVGSAGNRGEWGVSYPAAFPDVISVGASRISLLSGYGWRRYHAYYSNRGYRMDVVAPGGVLNSGLGRTGLPNAVIAQTFRLNQPTSMGYWFISGTSQAAAHVSGIAAWLLADGVPPKKVKELLLASADPMGTTTVDPYLGAGHVQLDQARTLVSTAANINRPKYYVNILPRVVSVSGLYRKGVARVQVMDGSGIAVANAKVFGTWFGSSTEYNDVGTTNSAGVAEISSNTVYVPSGAAFGFQVDGVAASGARLVSNPLQFYSLSPASAELFSRLMLDSQDAESAVLFKLDPGDSALSSLMNTSDMVTSYVMKPLGSGLRSGPMAVAFDGNFAPEITSATTNTTTRTYSWPSALESGRGPITTITGTRVQASSARLGSAARYLIFPIDPALGTMNASTYYPVLNAPAQTFLSENQAFGDGFAYSTMGNGFAYSTMGNEFASRSLGDGFAYSTLGNGFAYSTLGNGLFSAAYAATFASMTVGSSLTGAALATGFAESEGAGSAEDPEQALGASGDASENETVARLEGDIIEFGEVGQTTLVCSESELENLTGVPAYP